MILRQKTLIFPNLTGRVIISVMLMASLAQAIAGQVSDQRRLKGVRLTTLSVKKRPPEKPSPKTNAVPADYLEVPRDDLVVRLRLVNATREPLYYLIGVSVDQPVGSMLYRKKSKDAWASRSQSRGRPDEFTGDAYEWKLLLPGGSREFEVLDLSVATEQHAATVFVNHQPNHDGRVEIISTPYRPQLTAPTKRKPQNCHSIYRDMQTNGITRTRSRTSFTVC